MNSLNAPLCCSYKKWVSLTNHVTDDVMRQLQPLNGKISSVSELRSEGSNTQSRVEAAAKLVATSEATRAATSADGDKATTSSAQRSDVTDDGLPALNTSPEATIRFTPIPHRKYPEGATPAQMTQHSMDHSYVLRSLLDSHHRGDQMAILGEIQFAFVCFLLGQVFDAFEQWKQLVHLLCSSEEAIADPAHKTLYINFLSTLHFHLREIPEDFFVDIVTQNNFLVASLGRFFASLRSGDASVELKKRGQMFRENLEKRFHWSFSEADDEDAPVVVAL